MFGALLPPAGQECGLGFKQTHWPLSSHRLRAEKESRFKSFLFIYSTRPDVLITSIANLPVDLGSSTGRSGRVLKKKKKKMSAYYPTCHLIDRHGNQSGDNWIWPLRSPRMRKQRREVQKKKEYKLISQLPPILSPCSTLWSSKWVRALDQVKRQKKRNGRWTIFIPRCHFRSAFASSASLPSSQVNKCKKPPPELRSGCVTSSSKTIEVLQRWSEGFIVSRPYQ